MEMKHETFDLEDEWAEVMGQPEKNGAWLIWGNEKNGKTAFALKLALYLSTKEKVHYISAEEGLGSGFVQACLAAGVTAGSSSLHFVDYETVEEVNSRLTKRNAAKIVFIDNITFYLDELKNGGLRNLLLGNPKVLFVFLAHEERGEPYTATAKLCKRLAKLIFYVQTDICKVTGRCPGGEIVVRQQLASLLNGQQNPA